MRIDELTPGMRAVITAIDAGRPEEQRLREHGFDEGVEVELLHRAAFGADPIAFRVGSACVALRRQMAGLVSAVPAEFAEAAE